MTFNAWSSCLIQFKSSGIKQKSTFSKQLSSFDNQVAKAYDLAQRLAKHNLLLGKSTFIIRANLKVETTTFT